MASTTSCVFVVFSWLLALISLNAADTTPKIQVDGVGNPVYVNVLFSYRFVQPTVQATFNSAITGDQAFCRLTNFSKECAATDTAQPHVLDWASTASLPSSRLYLQYPDLQLYPTLANAIAPVYNLNGITDLVLTMQTLAKIWSGRITTWDHPDIQATNPNFNSWNVPANQSIALVARGDGSALTQLFKKVLGGTDPLFPASAAGWSGLNVLVQSTGLTLVSYVNSKVYSMGYASSQDALGLVPMVKLNRLGTIVEATTSSVQYAILEKGLSFGNNGDDPAHLTGDLTNAVSPLAWPFVSYSYVAVRKSTLRLDSTCATVSAMVDFLLWFWNSAEISALANPLGFSVLPEVVRDLVVARFKQDMRCGSVRVWNEPAAPTVVGLGPETALPIFDKFRLAYTLVNSSVLVNYTVLASDKVDVNPSLEAGGFLVSTAPPSSASNVFRLVLGIEAVVAISQFALTLNGVTLAKILNGDINTWLHPDIVALNPNGIRVSGQILNNTAQRIVLLQGPTAGSVALTTLLQSYYPAYTGAAIQAAAKYTREALLWSAVVGTPYSFSATALVGQLPTELQLAAIVSTGGHAVAPSLATAKACVHNATYTAASNAVTLSSPGGNSSCYPLLLTLYVSMKRQCPPDATAQAVTFLQWMFTADTLEAALDALNVVSLGGVSDAIQSTNEEALFQLSCGVRDVLPGTTDIVPLLLAIIIPIAAVVLTGIVFCGWWLWRVTESNRMLRKKFSNDNVAESCAEAIARFDLVAVEWLKEVKEPNKIQQAFLAIITLLTEVKPYIPDQLLSQLTTGKGNECHAAEEEDDNDTEQQSKMSTPMARDSIRIIGSEVARQESEHTVESSPARSNSRSHMTHRCTISSFDGSKQGPNMRDWRRKRCTYMCVRFGSTFRNADRRLVGLVQIAGLIVDIAKANGATIDAVGVDTVNVHWGVTGASGASAARAVLSGLEIMKLQDTLPEDQQASFWLQMGIGNGVCDCGTVSSASGHRFFVVWGPEASLAIEVAMTNLPKRVLTSLLVSPTVFQEVQFTVQCMPRLWHGDALLWEPRFALKKKEDDEWMYELEKMKEGSSLTHKTLLDTFLKAKDKGTTVADLSVHIAELHASHSGMMSAQDEASLDLLLNTAGMHSTNR